MQLIYVFRFIFGQSLLWICIFSVVPFLFFLFCVIYNRRTVKNIPKYAPAQFYIDNVLPRIKEKKIMSLKPFVDRLG